MSQPPNQGPPKPRLAPMRITVPSRSDAFLRKFTEVIGGPLGRHSSPGRINPGFFTVERVLVILTVIAALLAVVSKNACRLNGWGGTNSYAWACYSDWTALFHARGFAENAFAPFASGAQFEYPVLMSVVASLTAALIPKGEFDRALAFFDLNFFLVAGLWLLVVIATARTAGRRPWDAAMVAVAPGLILASTINWDMWAVAFLALAMLAWSRQAIFLAGVLIGLGTAMKVFPLLFFGAVIVLAIRTGRYKPLWVSLAGAGMSWLVVNLPLAVMNFDAWRHFFSFTEDRGAGLSSFWHIWNVTAGVVPGMPPLGASAINALALGLFVASCAGIAYLGLRAPVAPRLGQLVFLIVASFILFNKVYSPQFVVWLIPLAALAWPKWKDFLIWQLFEVLHFWAIWMYLYATTADIKASNTFPTAFYVYAVLGHMIATGYLMYRVSQSMFDPDLDPVRRVGQEDPQAGAFAGAEDKFVLGARHGA
ncbi:glycosyltransferase family 87 protein [Paeniglutamicibacter psychrophenolicus]|uniref:Membrane protein n=1 Tax=Paeniglutamicibacter psychrophenolicus TaxID=257454 RepID=A0ABS4W911_9MICC|nr:glycosyltransferase 87 family protein [Paeniglutamicibacter psychrophenolicus]MBP2372670.1 putative membrane protein [Paeniglutamicibacter psychrophenolicus]